MQGLNHSPYPYISCIFQPESVPADIACTGLPPSTTAAVQKAGNGI